MLKYEDKFLKIYFGDFQDKILKKEFTDQLILAGKNLHTDNALLKKQIIIKSQETRTTNQEAPIKNQETPENRINKNNILELKYFDNLKKIFTPKNIIFLNQVHGDDGELATENTIPFFKDGDFLATKTKDIAIGVLTADCLPIVFFDKQTSSCAIAHAGWQGSAKLISIKTIKFMQENFGSKISDIKIFFGPCIKQCCYEVGPDFLEKIKNFALLKSHDKEKIIFNNTIINNTIILEKSKKLYFNLPEFNSLILQSYGIKKDQIFLEYNICTHCNKNFFSYRRGDLDDRQMTIVYLTPL